MLVIAVSDLTKYAEKINPINQPPPYCWQFQKFNAAANA